MSDDDDDDDDDVRFRYMAADIIAAIAEGTFITLDIAILKLLPIKVRSSVAGNHPMNFPNIPSLVANFE